MYELINYNCNMKTLTKLFLIFENWFNKKFGWFFINGFKAIQNESTEIPNT
jgi:hypothetical protein